MLNSYKKLFVVLAVLVAPLMFVAACDDSAPPPPMDTPAPPDPPSDDTSLGNGVDILDEVLPGVSDLFIGLTEADDALVEEIVDGITTIDVAGFKALDSDLLDAVLDLDEAQLDILFTNINTVATGSANEGINSEVAMIQTAINGGLNDLFVYGQADGNVVFLGSNNDDIVALVDSLEITNNPPDSSSVESISFTAPCDVTAISLPEDVLAPADDGATVEVAIEGNTISPADGQYTLELADAGMMITITATVTAEDGETTEDFTLTVETPTVAACS
jgi:hypothetical protein